MRLSTCSVEKSTMYLCLHYSLASVGPLWKKLSEYREAQKTTASQQLKVGREVLDYFLLACKLRVRMLYSTLHELLTELMSHACLNCLTLDCRTCVSGFGPLPHRCVSRLTTLTTVPTHH